MSPIGLVAIQVASWTAGRGAPLVRPSATTCDHGVRAARAITMCDEEAADLNFLQTALNAAVEREDYEEAAALRDRVTAATSVQVGGGADWRAESVPEWLADRLARLNFRAPTLVQTNALRAILSGDDAAVVAATGSGKTLGYLVPLLSRLSEDLLEEDLSGYLADFLAGRRASAVRRSRLQGGRDESDLSLPTPAVLIVVPTRELGVQVSLLAYRLLGGGVSNPTLQPCAAQFRRRGRGAIPSARNSLTPTSRARAGTRTRAGTSRAARRTCSRTPGRATSASPVSGTSLGSTPPRTKTCSSACTCSWARPTTSRASRCPGSSSCRTSTRW